MNKKNVKLALKYIFVTFINTVFITSNAQNCLTETVAQNYITNQKITESSNYFLSNGFTTEELEIEFGNVNNPAIYTAFIIAKFVNDNPDVWILENNLIVGSDHPHDPYHCALEAFGILGIAQMLQGQLTKQGMLEIIRKVAPKALGIIGAAWAVYEFGGCMGWWGVAQYDIDFGDIILTNNYTYCE